MSHLRRSQRVSFAGGLGFELAGIVDQPTEDPKAFAVFAHCFTCTKDIKLIVRLSRGLAELGFGVLRYDATGLGNSAGDFSQTNFSTNCLDLLAAIEHLKHHFAAPQFLIGHSFGGAACLAVAQEASSVCAVAAIAAPSETPHLAQWLERNCPDIMRLGRAPVTIGGTEHMIDQQMLENFRAITLPDLLRRLSKPVMLLHSPDDETLGYEHVLRIFRMLTIRSADDAPPCPTSLICLAGADHLLTRQPADLAFVTHTLAAWFDRQLVDINRSQ
ncbi:MAG: alpha/beta fold hydrolase [Pirellulaceae bacterium]|nr:alpha/beta fold hydrolase [Pirellulaceae bacterium]